MSSIDRMKHLVFNGLLTRATLSELEDDGISVAQRVQDTADALEETGYSPLVMHEARKMAPVYLHFFCIENSVRNLIEERLSELHAGNWWSTKVPEAARKRVESLKDKESKNRYLPARSSSDIGYTLFGDLANIIVGNWDDFSDLFPDQHWVKSRFSDLETLRNVIMHTGTLPEIEIDRIARIAKDWLRQVG